MEKIPFFKKPEVIVIVGLSFLIVFNILGQAMSATVLQRAVKASLLCMTISFAYLAICHFYYMRHTRNELSRIEYVTAKCILVFAVLFYIVLNLKAHTAFVEPKNIFGFVIALLALNLCSLDNISSSEEIIKEPKKSFLQKLEL